MEKKENTILNLNETTNFAALKQMNKVKRQKKKQELKIRKKMLKLGTEYDSDITVFDVDLEKEYQRLSRDTKAQVEHDFKIAKEFKKEYIERLRKQQEKEEKEPSLEDPILDILKNDPKNKVEAYLNEAFPQISFENKVNYWVWMIKENDQKLLNGRKILKNYDINISHVAKYVRKIPVIFQILQSPFYRTELMLQFGKWRKMRENIFTEKLKIEEKMEKENPFDVTMQVLGQEEDEFTNFMSEIQPVLEHHQKLKFGGILKNFMDLWEIEEIYLGIFVVVCWITGKIQIERDPDEGNIEFVLKHIDIDVIDAVFDCNDIGEGEGVKSKIKEAKKDFISSVLDDVENFEIFSKNEIKNILSFVFDWLFEINKQKTREQEGKGVFSEIDRKKVGKLGLKAFVKDLDNIETLAERLIDNKIFQEFFDTECDPEESKFIISEENLEKLFTSEINIIGLKKVRRMKNELRSFSEITDSHLLIWFMSNLLLMDSNIDEKKKFHQTIKNDFEKLKGNIQNSNHEETTMNISMANEALFIEEENEEIEEEDMKDVEDSDEENYPEEMKKPNPLDTYIKSDLIPNYIPLLNIVNHFYLCITDNIFLRQTEKNVEDYEKIFQEYVDESQVLEIAIELKSLFSLCPPGSEINKLFRSSSPMLYEGIEGLWDDIKELVYFIHKKSNFKESKGPKNNQYFFYVNDFKKISLFDFSSEFEKFLENQIRDFLKGNLRLEDEIKISQLLTNDLYLDIVRHFDTSEIVKKIKIITRQSSKKLKDILFDLPEKSPKIISKLSELPEEGEESLGIPKIYYFSLRKDKELNMLFNSKPSCQVYITILKNIYETMDQVLCLQNAQKSSDDLLKTCLDKQKDMTKKGLNKEVDPLQRFMRDEEGRYRFKHKKLKQQWHQVRRFIPEFKNKGEKDSTIPKRVWDKVWPFIENSYWKVQLGFLTWYSLLVDEAPYEMEVRVLLQKIKFHQVVRRQTAIKVLGILSDHFKLFKDQLRDVKSEFKNIPWWVFSGSDCIFGYTDTDSKEHVDWQSMVLENIINWVAKRDPENYAGFPLKYDIEMSMEHFLKDFKVSLTQGYLINYQEDLRYLPETSQRDIKKINMNQQQKVLDERKNSKLIFEDENEEFVLVKDYFSWCKKFLRFSVSGAAYGIKIDSREIEGVSESLYKPVTEGEEFKKKRKELEFMNEIQESDPEEAKKKREQYLKSIREDNEDIEEDEVNKVDESKINLMKECNEKRLGITIRNQLENQKQKSMSKTAAFALGGKSLARIYFWSGGEIMIPQFTLHLKKEPKKIRNVANSDLSSFVKQTFLYEWLGKAFNETSKNKIYTLIHPRNKVRTIERIVSNFKGEKWAVPMDLKDFHIQFGPNNHKALMDCLLRRLDSIRDTVVRKELKYVILCLKDELCRGKLFLYINTLTEDSMANAFDKLSKEQKEIMKLQLLEKHEKDAKNKIEKKNKEPNLEMDEYEKKNKPDEKTKVETKRTQNIMSFDVQNGLMSGWKLTSLMGSIYNNSTNMFCNFWHLNKFRLVPTNYITQGDDTHFKCRFMTQAMFHIGLVNSIGKIAHPNKQFFSPGMTEFLKKTYDLFQKKMYYSPARMISSILYEKENRKSKANNKNNMKDVIDVWNLFTVRIPNQKRREFIRDSGYPQNSVRIKFKWHTEAQGSLSYLEIDKLFSTPSSVNGYLLGPLTKRGKLCQENNPKYENMGFELYDSYFDAEMYDYKMTLEPECKEKNWIGIQSFVSNMLRVASGGRKARVSNVMRNQMIKMVFECINESLREYQAEKVLGEMRVVKFKSEVSEVFLREIDNLFPQMMNFFMENMKLYLEGFDLATPWGQLMILNNTLSKQLELGLRKSNRSMNNYDIFQAISGLKNKSKFTSKLFHNLSEKMSSVTLFKFALSCDIGPSMSRFIQHDEYLGMFSLVINESIPLLFKNIIDFDSIVQGSEVLRNLEISKEEQIILREKEQEEMAERTMAEDREDDRKEKRSRSIWNNEGKVTRDVMEEMFLDVLVKVIEVYVFLNSERLWKEIREHAVGLVNNEPF